MKKAIFIILIGSILIGQSRIMKHPIVPNKNLSNQEIQRMVHNQVINRSANILDDPTTGRPTKTVDLVWMNNEWQNNMMTEYVYAPLKTNAVDFPGLNSINYYYWMSGMWYDNGSDVYTRDGQGNVTEILQNYDGSPWGRWTFTGPFYKGASGLSIKGNPTVSIYQYYDNGWINSQRVTYTFDSNGCIIDEVWEMWDGSAWVFSTRIQYSYSQGCCPDRWVFSMGNNNAWVIYYMAAFTYAGSMTDKVPFFNVYSYWWYTYVCNPTVVLMGPTTDGTNMSSIDSREEYTYTDCLAMTYTFYYYLVGSAIYQLTNYYYSTWTGKVSSAYDNSNQRFTSQVTQVNDGTNLVNSTKTWYSYEGLKVATESDNAIPTTFSLEQNFPNPFNPATTITFDLSEDTDVKISIYNMTGQLIRELVDQSMTIGSKTIDWDGKDDGGNSVSGGVYLYNLQTGNYNQTKKMVLVK